MVLEKFKFEISKFMIFENFPLFMISLEKSSFSVQAETSLHRNYNLWPRAKREAQKKRSVHKLPRAKREADKRPFHQLPRAKRVAKKKRSFHKLPRAKREA